MPENLMCPEHKSNSDKYRKEWVRIFSLKGLPVRKVIFNDRDFTVVGNPFATPAKFTFDPVNYGVVAVKTQKDNPCPKA